MLSFFVPAITASTAPFNTNFRPSSNRVPELATNDTPVSLPPALGVTDTKRGARNSTRDSLSNNSILDEVSKNNSSPVSEKRRLLMPVI